MNIRIEHINHINYPEECPKCHNGSVTVVSTFDSEYWRHWVRVKCNKCQRIWTEIYQLDA